MRKVEDTVNKAGTEMTDMRIEDKEAGGAQFQQPVKLFGYPQSFPPYMEVPLNIEVRK
ncbi:MAG: hypothetical protein ABSE95_19330 [Thermodesulfobacteriota bacterium]|jgi:hypothetical protein